MRERLGKSGSLIDFQQQIGDPRGRELLIEIEHEILGGTAEAVHSVVSPLAFAPRVDRDRRFIFAGMGDRMATPVQAQRLWEHWEQPAICWYAGNHVGYLWSGAVREFLTESIRAGIDQREGRPSAARRLA